MIPPRTPVPLSAAQVDLAVDAGASLPQLTPPWAAALTCWALARPTRSAIELGERRWELTWLAADAAVVPVVTVPLRCQGRCCELQLESLAGLDPRLVGRPFASAPSALRERVLHAVLADWATALPAPMAQGLEFETVRWTAAAPIADRPDAIALPWQLVHSIFGSTSRGRLVVCDAELLVEWAAAWPTTASTPRLRMPVRVRVAIGAMRVDLCELRGLEPGDWVWVADAHVDHCGIRVLLEAHGSGNVRHWPGTLRADQIRLSEPPAAALLPIPSTEPAMAPDASHLTVPVTVDLAELALPAHELERLAPQQIVQLPFDSAHATARLCVAGQPIAEGQLVAVGRRLGVRITRVLAG